MRNKLGEVGWASLIFFDRIYLEIIEDPCYNTTGKQNKQLLWHTGI